MNSFDMPTQLEAIHFHNTHDTLCVPKGMTLKQLVEDYDRLNNIIDELEKYFEDYLKEYDNNDYNNYPAWKSKLDFCKHSLNKLKELKEGK